MEIRYRLVQRSIAIKALAVLFVAMLGVTVCYSAYSNLPANHTPRKFIQSTGFDYSSASLWQRIVRLRALDPNSSWSPTGYTANQILAMISDLRPTMLQRYINSHQIPTAPVPVCPTCAPMNVQEFLQLSENTTGAVIVPRISINDYDISPALFYGDTASLINFPINPPMRILSIDNYNQWIKLHNQTLAAAIMKNLTAQGWIWIEGGGPTVIPTGSTNYGSVSVGSPCWCVNPNDGYFTKPGILHVLQTFSFPSDTALLLSYNFTTLVNIMTNIAINQTKIGYIMDYFIIQGGWDTTKIVGPNGQSLYQVMRDLMIRYNSPSTGPDFAIIASPSSLSVQVGSSTAVDILVASEHGFSGNIFLTATVTPTGPSTAFSGASLSLSSGGTGSSTLKITTTSSTPLGSYSVTVNSTSGTLSHIVYVSLDVSTTPPPPNFTINTLPPSLNIQTGQTGSSIIYVTSVNGFGGTVSLNETSSTSLDVSLNQTTVNLSPGSSKTITITVGVATNTTTGTDLIQVSGTSGALTNPTQLTVMVTLGSSLLVLSVPGPQSVTAGSRLIFRVAATEPYQKNTVTLTVTSLPNGASFNPSTGNFSWTPTSSQLGTYNVAFTAKDNGSPALYDKKTVTIQVQKAQAQPPSPPPGSNNCFWCTTFTQLRSYGFLFAFGVALGLVATLTLLYLRARGSLGNARRMRLVVGRVATSPN